MMSALILWLLRCARKTAGAKASVQSSRFYRQPIVTASTGAMIFHRFCPFWFDEYVLWDGTHKRRPPWWRPFNILLHHWVGSDGPGYHDHPRWSITICLRGRIIENTLLAGARELRAWDIVFRKHTAVHRFDIVPGYEGKTWTVFIVGRRRVGYRQTIYHKKTLGVTSFHSDEDEDMRKMMRGDLYGDEEDK